MKNDRKLNLKLTRLKTENCGINREKNCKICSSKMKIKNKTFRKISLMFYIFPKVKYYKICKCFYLLKFKKKRKNLI